MKEIIDILKKFQKGYDEKIPENAPALIANIFSDRQDLGTGTGELCFNRDEVMELIRSDWDGGWGDFKIDIANAKIEVDGDIAWFFANCNLKYTFEDSAERDEYTVEIIKDAIEKTTASPEQRLSFLSWCLALRCHHWREPKREHFWPSEISGMMVKENGGWKIAAIHFATDKPDYPDERFEQLTEEYQSLYQWQKEKILTHNGENKPDKELLDSLRRPEDGFIIDLEQVAVFGAGQFFWIMAFGVEEKEISEDEVMERAFEEISDTIVSDMPAQDKILAAKRSIGYALKEAANGAKFTWPIRLTAVVEKTDNGYKFRHKHFSYPFGWIIEGKF